MYLQFAASAENEDNVAEQKRQHGKRVRYGEVVQVRFCSRRLFFGPPYSCAYSAKPVFKMRVQLICRCILLDLLQQEEQEGQK